MKMHPLKSLLVAAMITQWCLGGALRAADLVQAQQEAPNPAQQELKERGNMENRPLSGAILGVTV